MLRFVPACLQQKRNFKAEELATTALSLAKTFTECGEQALPGAVSDFLASVAFLVPLSIARFSTQSLFNVVSAFTLVGGQDASLFDTLGQEVTRRRHTMASQELVRGQYLPCCNQVLVHSNRCKH